MNIQVQVFPSARDELEALRALYSEDKSTNEKEEEEK